VKTIDPNGGYLQFFRKKIEVPTEIQTERKAKGEKWNFSPIEENRVKGKTRE
jgi:hypothetical protein